jgi:UDP-N-acetylmuramate dehydrogenase
MRRDEPVYVVGLGSNLLVRDGGVKGTVVVLHARLNALRLERQDKDAPLIYAEAGLACAKVARFAALHNLRGAEFLAGIPGTIGGALAMNAGCYSGETWQIVDHVQTLDREGRFRTRNAGDYAIAYRQVVLKPEARTARHNEETVADASYKEWFVGGWFRLVPGDEAESRQKIKRFLAMRVNSQPLNLPNAGSVFRNPPGDWAARLIESCGLKGLRIGGAMVSPKHANFIVNTGMASATDIEALIVEVRRKVKEGTGVELEPEVRIIGVTA